MVENRDRCPTCSSTLQYYRYGQSLVVRCPISACNLEAVTSYRPPIWVDNEKYRIVIPPLDDAPARTLVALNRRFTHGIVVTKQMFSSKEQELIQGSAWTIWHEALRLRSEEIPFRIEPEFPFDLDDPTTAFGPPDGPLPGPPDFLG